MAKLDRDEDTAGTSSAGAKVVWIIRSVLTYLLAAGIILAAALFAVNKSPQKSLFGYRYYTVLTSSMEPTYSAGDIVVVRLSDADEIDVGDVITFNPSSDSTAYLTHRVTEKLENYEGTGTTAFRTKGDANDSEDSFLIVDNRVIGKAVCAVPILGYAIRFVQLRWYFVLPLVILLMMLLYLIRKYFEVGKGKQESQAVEPKTTVEMKQREG